MTTSTTHLDIGVHDPSMIWDGSNYYLLATGGSLNMRVSPDLMRWTNAGRVYSAIPSWATAIIGSGLTSLWAPDISYFNGMFHVYWAGSTFGSNTSVIGLATNVALDSTKPGFAWVDQGMVLQSKSGTDNFNAIDPNVAFDETGAPWLAYGSFWSGIKLQKLDPATGKLVDPGSDPVFDRVTQWRSDRGRLDHLAQRLLLPVRLLRRLLQGPEQHL